METERAAVARRMIEEDPVLVPLGRAFRRALSAFERDTGVGAPRWFMLRVVAGEEGVSQGEVCRRFEQDPSRITRLAQALEADGLLRRERDPEDSRVVRLYLTDEGRDLTGTFPRRYGEFERRVEGAMSGEELRELRRLLGLLEAAMTD